MSENEYYDLIERYNKLDSQLKRLYSSTRDALTQSVRSSGNSNLMQSRTGEQCDAISMRLETLKCDLDSEKRKAADLIDKLEEKTVEVSFLSAQIGNNNSQFAEREHQLVNQIEQLNTELSDLRFALNKSQAELSGERDRHQKEITDMESKLMMAIREKRVLNTAKEDLDNTLKSLKSAFDQIAEQKREISEEFVEEMQRSQQKLRDLDTINNELQQAVNEKQQAINSQSVDIRGLLQSLEESNQKRIKLEQRLTVYEVEIVENDQKWHKLVSQYELSRNDLEMVRSENQSLKSLIEEGDKTLCVLKTHITALEADLKSEKNIHEQEKLQMIANANQTGYSSRQLVNNLTAVTDELQNTKAELQELHAQMVTIESKMVVFFTSTESQTEISSDILLDRLLKEAKFANNLRHDQEKLNQHISDMEQSYSTLNESHERLESEMNNTRQAMQAADTQIKELQDEKSELIQENNDVMRRLENAEQVKNQMSSDKIIEIQELMTRLASSEKRLKQLINEKRQSDERIETLIQEVDQSQATITEKDFHLVIQENQLSATNIELKNAKRSLETETDRATQFLSDLQRVTQDRDSNKSILITLQSQNKLLASEVDMKSATLTKIQEELSTTKSYQSQYDLLSLEFQKSISDRETLVHENDVVSQKLREKSEYSAMKEEELRNMINERNDMENECLRLDARMKEILSANELLKNEISGNQNQVISNLTEKNDQLNRKLDELSSDFRLIQNQYLIVSSEFESMHQELQATTLKLTKDEKQYRKVIDEKDEIILKKERLCVEAKRDQYEMKVNMDRILLSGGSKRGLEITEGDSIFYSIARSDRFSLSYCTPNVMVTEDRLTAFSSVPGRNCVFIDRVITSQDRFTISFSVNNQLNDLMSICIGGIHAPFNDLSTSSAQMYLFNAGQGLANHCPTKMKRDFLGSAVIMKKGYPQCSVHTPYNWFPIECDITFGDTIIIAFEGKDGTIRIYSDISEEPLFEFSCCNYPIIPCIYTLECPFFSVDINNDMLISRSRKA